MHYHLLCSDGEHEVAQRTPVSGERRRAVVDDVCARKRVGAGPSLKMLEFFPVADNVDLKVVDVSRLVTTTRPTSVAQD